MKISLTELEKLVGDLTEAVTKTFEIRMKILDKTEIHSEEMFSLLDQVTNGEISNTKAILNKIIDMEIFKNLKSIKNSNNCLSQTEDCLDSQIEDEGMDR